MNTDNRPLKRILSNSRIPKLKTDSSKDNIQINNNDSKKFRSKEIPDYFTDTLESSNEFINSSKH